jgi:proteasome lid subunit RPN8/RPN11
MIKENIKDEKECVKSIIQICEEKKHNEICGFVGLKNGKFVLQECENIADDKIRHFAINPVDYLLFQDQNEFLFLFHSHIAGDEKPSQFDVVMSENSCLPFFIYSLSNKKSNIYIPKTHEVDVLIINRFKESI